MIITSFPYRLGDRRGRPTPAHGLTMYDMLGNLNSIGAPNTLRKESTHLNSGQTVTEWKNAPAVRSVTYPIWSRFNTKPFLF